jgi:WD40 repeat protein/tRNA A-37 threonylcarbamoyl transferase component Bud32
MQVIEDPRVGTLLAGYRLEALLGRGGMSVVYLAEDVRLKRKVAVKLLAAHLAEDATFRERFLHESELAASSDHPNIIPIYEAGEVGELLFIAMRYVEGSDLKGRLRKGPLDASQAIGILGQVASALDAAHARGLVHRDVKPSNVLLDPGARPDRSDHVYLTDFGLTMRLSDSAGVGEDSHLMGTLDYVAPEQIAGEMIDGRADVYSLGCVLYECLVGEPPFRRSSEVEVVYAHLQDEPPVASARRPELPEALDAVIATALAKEPEQRYSSCGDMIRAALAVTVEEASRLLADVASRAAAGRNHLSRVEAELAGKVSDLQLVREQARVLAGDATPTQVVDVCPFKGLASFESADADFFFGRERLIAEVIARLAGARFLGIVGPSGSGKSSVLRAGLVPALASGVLPGSERWRRVLIRPGARPLDELRRVFASGAEDPLAEALDVLTANERLFLAVDQLEEVFTTCGSEEERADFAGSLARAAADPKGRALVVVAVRADFYGRFAAYPSLAELLGANHVLVSMMQPSELRRAIELPAGRVGLRAEPELADALVDDVEGEPGALPLLSTALLELWQKRQDNALTLAVYRESGGVHGAVARLAEGTYARIPDEHKPLVRAMMLRLVGEGDAAVRRRAPLAELDLERNQEARDVLATLTESRLLTVSEGSVEVAHEALLREWPRLRGWIDEDGQGRRLRHHITQAATEWDRAGRDRGELYRGARLAAALDWSTDHAFELNVLERVFVTESREATEEETRRVRSTNRRLRGLLAGVAVLLAAAVAGGMFAAIQRGEARDAETAQLAQRLGAQALVEEDLDLSLLLARQAVAIDDTPQTRGYLLATLTRTPEVTGVMHGQGGVLIAVSVSPDGKTLAVADVDVALHFFDVRTYGRIGEPLPVTARVGSLAYSPDGGTLAFGGDGYMRLIDASTYEQLAETRVDGFVTKMAFTKDGAHLVSLVATGECGDASISVRNTTLLPVGPTIEPEDFTSSYVGHLCATPFFVMTPDGRSLVTASTAGELAWWDIESREKIRTVDLDNGLRALALSPDGLTAAVGIDRGIQLIDVRTGAARTASGALAGAPSWLLFSPDGQTIVSTSLDPTVVLWDTETVTVRKTLRGHSRAVWQPVFSPDGETLYTASSDGTAIAWDVGGDRGLGRPFTFTHDRAFDPIFDRHPGRFSPDGQLIAVGLKEEGIGLWDATDLTPTGAPLTDTGGEVKALAFSPDGKTLVAVTTSGMATVWEMDSRSLLQGPFAVDSLPVLGVSFSADGTMFATAAGGGVKLWSVASGAALGSVGDGSSAGDVAFSPTGSLVALVREGWDPKTFSFRGGGNAEIWDVALRSPIATLQIDPAGQGGYAIAFSPDGLTLATGGIDPLVHVWDVRTGELIRELDQGAAGAETLKFSPGGRILAVSGFEPIASLWDVASGTQIGPGLTAGSRRAMLDLSPDGRRLLMTLGNGQGAVWDIDPESWLERACALANRELTPKEWEEFLPDRSYEPACPG